MDSTLRSAGRFLTHQDQFDAMVRARKILQNGGGAPAGNGRVKIEFSMDREIGEGYARTKMPRDVDPIPTDVEYMRTTNVTAIFEPSGDLLTMYPKLEMLK